MERTVAVKKLGKLLGKSLGYQIDDMAPTADERTAAKAELAMAVAERDQLKQQRDERYKTILAADQEYQALHAAAKKASERVSQLSGISHSYKFTVGLSNSMFFHVKAQGDSWEEVIRKVEEVIRKVKERA